MSNKFEVPKVIYLIDDAPEIYSRSWCDDPAPEEWMDPSKAIKYVLQTEVDAINPMSDVFKTLESKFTSHNSVEVERTTLTRVEYDQVQEMIESLKVRIDQLDSLVQSYKGQYYDEREENEKLKAENDNVRRACESFRSELDKALLERNRLIAMIENVRGK